MCIDVFKFDRFDFLKSGTSGMRTFSVYPSWWARWLIKINFQVYFLWICPSHKHFEWFIDVLRDVERKDVTNVLEIHIFITQFFHKFDLRTTMLYICENHFQRLSKTSMFTGLKAVNHFGRPDMTSFLKFVQKKHSYVS